VDSVGNDGHIMCDRFDKLRNEGKKSEKNK
jgi:hypothetical protein